MKKNTTNYYSFILALFLIITYIFKDKIIYLGPSLNVSISLFVYSFTFFIVAIIVEKYKIKEAKSSILNSALILILFCIVCSLLCSFNSNTDSQLISTSLRNILAPNYFECGYDIVIYYPDLFSLFSLTIVYIITHQVMAVTYEATKSYSNYIMAFILAILISFIIDVMLYIPINNILNLLNQNMDIIDLVKLLTANFLVVISCSVVYLFLYPFFVDEKKH